MKIGPVEITFGKKSYNELVTMLRREQTGGLVNLKTQPKTQLGEYKSWVSSCVSLISDRISSLPYSFYNKNTGEELTTKNKGYQIFTKPFRNPNDLMSFRFIKSFCQVQLDMCGMSFIYMARNQLGQVWELWPLNMNDFIKCDVSDDVMNPTVSYHFKSGNNIIDFDISQLVILNYVHPVNPYIGASPVQSQAYAQDIDSYIEVYERDFFKNSARIDFALTTDEKIDQPKADELKERWKEKYQGTFHDVAVLDSGLKPVPLQYSNRDFEFLNLAKWSMEKVFAAYRVPKSKLGFGEGGRSGDVQSDISFNREAIQPRLNLWDEEITKEIMVSFNENIEFKHLNPIPRDRLIEVQEGRIHVGLPTLTINEFREKTHLFTAVDGGDRIFIPKDMIPLDRIDEVIDAGILAQETSTDPEDDDRDDEPDSHVNPDGSDDRDDNPTDDRSIDTLGNVHFKFLCDKIRDTINDFVKDNIAVDIKQEKDLENNLKIIFSDMIIGMVDYMLDYFGEKTIYKDVDLTDWMAPISDKVVIEYRNTLTKNSKWNEEDWKIYFKNQMNSNPRLSKITNSLSRACINYAKWLIFRERKEKMLWVVNSNECGHKGKLKDNTSEDHFQIGNMKLRFPNEVLNFSCDCTITKNQLMDKE
jgi:HK97 family phage portal protein